VRAAESGPHTARGGDQQVGGAVDVCAGFPPADGQPDRTERAVAALTHGRRLVLAAWQADPVAITFCLYLSS